MTSPTKPDAAAITQHVVDRWKRTEMFTDTVAVHASLVSSTVRTPLITQDGTRRAHGAHPDEVRPEALTSSHRIIGAEPP